MRSIVRYIIGTEAAVNELEARTHVSNIFWLIPMWILFFQSDLGFGGKNLVGSAKKERTFGHIFSQKIHLPCPFRCVSWRVAPCSTLLCLHEPRPAAWVVDVLVPYWPWAKIRYPWNWMSTKCQKWTEFAVLQALSLETFPYLMRYIYVTRLFKAWTCHGSKHSMECLSFCSAGDCRSPLEKTSPMDIAIDSY